MPDTDIATKLAVGYLRRSTDRQEQSIPDQRAAIERYADEHGFRILQYYTDDAISGTSAVGRPCRSGIGDAFAAVRGGQTALRARRPRLDSVVVRVDSGYDHCVVLGIRQKTTANAL